MVAACVAQDRTFRIGEVVLSEARDPLEQVAAAVVVQPTRGKPQRSASEAAWDVVDQGGAVHTQPMESAQFAVNRIRPLARELESRLVCSPGQTTVMAPIVASIPTTTTGLCAPA